MIRVLVADDEALMRAGMRLVLETAGDIEVVAEAADGHQAVTACVHGVVDVALVDVRMPGADGLAAVGRIAARAPRVRVLMLTTFHDPEAVSAALGAGAAGFLLKDTGPQELIQAVRAAARGEPVLAPRVLRDIVAEHVGRARPPGDGRAHADARARISRLSDAERHVLQVLAEGATNGEIARRLFMSTGAVKAHIGRILTKLDCENRVQAAILAHDAGRDGPRTTSG